MKTNRLINEDSPYLKAHAADPIDWYPWSSEAFEKAKKEDKLIFLSIGYSTCHWCHVMQRESFKNEEIADILNKNFVSIKVDREEMPQIDKYYQDVFYVMRKRGGGWPLTVIMTPQRGVFFVDTYLPPDNRYSKAGLKTVLVYLLDLYENRREEVIKSANSVKKALKSLEKPPKYREKINDEIAVSYVDRIWERFDKTYKGIGSAPKFPHASNIDLLLDIYLIFGNKKALDMAVWTLEAMVKGGIYDQIEGGFFRYSTHPDWIIPHFEKMLYTQAELIPIYVKAYLLTNKALYKKVVLQTVEETIKRFKKDSLFYSASDADSEKREGGYFIYSFKEVFNALKKEGFNEKEIKNITEYFDINPIGNFQNSFSNPQTNTQIKKPKNLKKAIFVLRKIRQKRKFPFIDKKIITSWNAMMIKALFKASLIKKDYAKTAIDSLEKLIETVYKRGILYHQFVENYPLKQKAYLEDYAFLISALIEAYETAYERKYLLFAKKLAKEAIKKFYENKTWYLDDGKIRAKSVYQDRYYTSALSQFFDDLITISYLTDDRNLLYETKKFLKDEKVKILNKIDASPKALEALLRIKYQDIVIKSKKENLLKNRIKIAKISYPFILTNIQNSDLFIACGENNCFAFDKNLSKIIAFIQKDKKEREKMQRR